MPLPVLVVDERVNVLECNTAAARLLKKDEWTGQHRRGGDLLHCLHAMETPKGCGCASACTDCQIRKAVRAAAKGRSVNRQWAEMVLMQEGKPARVSLRISCQPFTYEKNSFVLLVLEGLNN